MIHSAIALPIDIERSELPLIEVEELDLFFVEQRTNDDVNGFYFKVGGNKFPYSFRTMYVMLDALGIPKEYKERLTNLVQYVIL